MERIGYFVPEFPGQTHNFFWRELEELSRLGVQVQLISTRRPAKALQSASWGSDAARRTFYLHPPSFRELPGLLIRLVAGIVNRRTGVVGYLVEETARGPRRAARAAALLLYAARLAAYCRREGLSHVHVHSCADALTVAMLAGALGGITYGMTLHNPLVVYGPGQPRKWASARYAIVITEALRQEVIRELAGRLPPLLGVAPMGVDVHRFHRSSPYVPAVRGMQVRMACCARLNMSKGHLELVKTLKRLVDAGIDVKLTIAGEDDAGGRGFRHTLEAHIAELGIGDRVRLLGAVPEEAVRSLIESAHLFVLASYEEPLGVALMEAMAMEVPVIVTRSPGTAELIEDGRHGVLVAPRDEQAMAEAIERLLDRPDEATALGARGRDRVAKLYSSARSAVQIRDFLLANP